MYNRGLVIGKFYPPHPGHYYLIETARQRCSHLTVVLCDRLVGISREIPAGLRLSWMKEHFKDDPGISFHIYKQPDWLPDSNSQMWAAVTMDNWGVPDVVFTSESYGEAWAKAMGCTHVSVDPSRIVKPISGTAVRNNPYKHWDVLEEPVRAWYAKRVVITGAESTGTTTLTRALAEHYQTAWVPEYGRTLYEGFMHIPDSPNRWTPEDLAHIADIHAQTEDWLARKANKILFLDTDAMTTQQWHRRFFGQRSLSISEIEWTRIHDAYIVTGDEIPFVQDGTRNDPPEDRPILQRYLIEAVEPPYILVTGDQGKRLRDAIAFLESNVIDWE